MKWKLILAIVLFSCCKKSLTDQQKISNAEKTIVGKWRLIQYYRENVDGTGNWVPTDTSNIQEIGFSAEGKFTHNKNFVIQAEIDRYKFQETYKVLLYSSTSTDSVKYFYRQDGPQELIFNPICLEFSCMRKFIRLE